MIWTKRIIFASVTLGDRLVVLAAVIVEFSISNLSAQPRFSKYSVKPYNRENALQQSKGHTCRETGYIRGELRHQVVDDGSVAALISEAIFHRNL